MTSYLNIPQFAKAAGRSVSYVKREIVEGNLPYKNGRLLGRDENLEPIFAPMLSTDDISKHLNPDLKKKREEDRVLRDRIAAATTQGHDFKA